MIIDVRLVEAMEAAGYWFDDFSSYDGYLLFSGHYGTSMDFECWADVEEWLRGVVFDDPDVSDAVERIMRCAW